MNLVAPVSSIMAKDIQTVMPKDSISRVKEIFDRTKAFHIPVVKSKRVVGMIYKGDFMSFCNKLSRHFNGKADPTKCLKGHTAEEVMSGVSMVLECGDRIAVALEMFRDDALVALPVHDKSGFIGMVTTHEVIEALAKEKAGEYEYYSIY